MKHTKKKKAVLGTAISLLAPAIVRLIDGNTVEGYILVGISVGLIVLYDHLDDKAKGEPTLPPGVDSATFIALAEQMAGIVDDVRDTGGSNGRSNGKN